MVLGKVHTCTVMLSYTTLYMYTEDNFCIAMMCIIFVQCTSIQIVGVH